MQGAAIPFFVLLAAILVGIYLGIRREWAAPGMIAGGGVVASIIAMLLVSLAQGNSIIQAVVVSVVVGFLLSGATLAMAWYFHSNELRDRYIAKQSPPSSSDMTGDV